MTAPLLELAADPSHDWSLWQGRQPMHPDDLGLDDELRAELLDWHRFWAVHRRVGEPSGWDDPASANRHRRDAARLVEQLTQALPQWRVQFGPPRPAPDAQVWRFFPDWGHQWPLWHPEGGTGYPDELGLSPALQRELAQWYAHWAEHTRFDGDGWDHPDSRAEHERWGDDLVERLRWEAPSVVWQPEHRKAADS